MSKLNKTLEQIEADMSDLYDKVAAGTTELKLASELANIAGKNLKAKQLALARDIFIKQGVRVLEPA